MQSSPGLGLVYQNVRIKRIVLTILIRLLNHIRNDVRHARIGAGILLSALEVN